MSCITTATIVSILLCFCQNNSISALLLSDLPTPSFVIDTKALHKASGVTQPQHLLNIHLPKHGITLFPLEMKDGVDKQQVRNLPTFDAKFELPDHGGSAIGYLHTSVIRAQEDVTLEDEPVDTFLAELDLTPSLCHIPEEKEDKKSQGDVDPVAHLVLGLNNHHVGSYYWARSAGAGSSMDAPGVRFGDDNSSNKRTNSKGILRWDDDRGPTACNSNDGKRSEWLNFLRVGDTVQLLPTCGQDAVLAFIKRYGTQQHDFETDSWPSIRVFGVSSEGRPLGSEPSVVCKWTCSKECLSKYMVQLQ